MTRAMMRPAYPTTAPVIQQRLAELDSAQVAVLADDDKLTFSELHHRANLAAAALGPCPGRVVPVTATSTAAFVAEILGVWLAGGVPMPLDPRMPAPLREAMIRHASTGGAHTCRPWKAIVSVSGGAYRPLITGGEPPTAARKAHALGLGTTETTPDGSSVALIASPLHLNGPFEFAMRHLLRGGTLIVLSTFDPSAWAAAAAATRPTWAFLVPTQIHRLLEHADPQVIGPAIAGLQTLVHSSAPCPAQLWNRLTGMVDKAAVAQYYGAAEYDGTLLRGEQPGGPAGPLPGALLRVVDAAGQPVAPGTSGVIEGRSAAGLGHHYAGERCATASLWRTVGDQGRIDAQGRLTVTGVAVHGRAIVGGVNVALHRVHAVVASHPGVLTCQVVPVDDPQYGQRITVRVTTDWPVPAGTLRAYCARNLTPAERPVTVHVHTDAPTVQEPRRAVTV